MTALSPISSSHVRSVDGVYGDAFTFVPVSALTFLSAKAAVITLSVV